VHSNLFVTSDLPHGYERRRNRRFAVRCDCWLERDDTTIYGTTADVGMGGLFLRTAIPLKPGKKFDVRLYVNGSSNPVLARGFIARSILARGGVGRYGVGVAFTSIEKGRDQLGYFLQNGSTLPS
jgi:hypothetical protein